MITVLEKTDGQSGLVALVGVPGPAGPPGPPGSGGAVTLSLAAGASGVSGHRVVAAIGGVAVHADIADPAHADAVIGLSLGAAAGGAPATIQASGEVAESSWAWTPGQPLFVAAGGMLSHTAPAAGWTQLIAVAISSTRILLNPRQAVYLA